MMNAKGNKTVAPVLWGKLFVFALIILLIGCGGLGRGNPSRGRSWVGMASWYGEKYHGQQTTSGEIFDMHKFTAAHKTLPLGTRIRVTNLKNHKSVVVRINDRGPFAQGRILDISYGAAKKIGMIEDGVTRVRIQIVD